MSLSFIGALLTVAAAAGLGCLLTYRTPVAPPVRFGAGAAALSLLIFLLMSANAARRPVLIGVAVAASLGLALAPRLRRLELPPWWVLLVLLPYGFWYLVNAAAPELQTDPNTYHLTPARDALRYGGFSGHISFYERLPHATELLYVIAFAVGGAPAAKLVHFFFLCATLPLIVQIVRRLELSDVVGWGAASMYFLSPVASVAGTSAFNDAALAFAAVAMVAVLVEDGPAWIAGTLAGFCYAIKMTGGIAVPVGLAFLVFRRRWREGLVFAFAAAALIAPWLLRNYIQTGNPVAPFLNSWFPNPWFEILTEQQLGASLRSYGVGFGARFSEVLWGYRLQGILGPVFVLAPLALLGLRSHAGRVLAALAVALSIPWWLNAGARFLMPSLPFVATAMLAPLPRAAVIAVMAVHAVTSWPHIVASYSPLAWRLEALPLARADAILESSWEYRAARMIAQHTRPGDRILDMHGVHAAHVDREFWGWWQSARAQRAFDVLEFSRDPADMKLYELRATFPRQDIGRVRIRQTGAATSSWSIPEIEFYQGAFRVASRRSWTLNAEPNSWAASLAFDRNLATRWRSEQSARPGMNLSVEFGEAQALTAIRVIGTRWDGATRMEIELAPPGGAWRRAAAVETSLPVQDLRRHATQAVKRCGFTHIVAHAGHDGTGILGYLLANQAPEFGIEVVDHLDNLYLFRVP